MKEEPCPGVLRTCSPPRWQRSTPMRAARPSPRPVNLVEKKSSKMRPRISGGMPEPVSITSRVAQGPDVMGSTQVAAARSAGSSCSGPGLDRDPGVLVRGTGLHGVGDQVHDDLEQLGGIARDLRQRLDQIALEHHPCGQGG